MLGKYPELGVELGIELKVVVKGATGPRFGC
jgi:hypothetical protein